VSAYNHVTLIGNLVKDPEMKKVGKNSKTDFTIAVDRYVGKDKEAEVDFFNIVSWGKLAEISGEYLKKGKKILVDGRIQVRSYEVDKQRKWITEVIAENLKFLTAKEQTNLPAE
jgi:single-strand DNA-binding protein